MTTFVRTDEYNAALDAEKARADKAETDLKTNARMLADLHDSTMPLADYERMRTERDQAVRARDQYLAGLDKAHDDARADFQAKVKAEMQRDEALIGKGRAESEYARLLRLVQSEPLSWHRCPADGRVRPWPAGACSRCSASDGPVSFDPIAALAQAEAAVLALRGLKFSDRMYAAIKSRMERAEAACAAMRDGVSELVSDEKLRGSEDSMVAADDLQALLEQNENLGKPLLDELARLRDVQAIILSDADRIRQGFVSNETVDGLRRWLSTREAAQAAEVQT